ncbi:hypothetical protein N8766_01355 [bacterium]|jgi:hypothetical protein|nr:hypothetical protein [bacterium]MDA7680498.1 hypothetical protein [bacterium]
MKKIIVLLLIGALTTLSTNRLNAGDKEWSVVGKILTGVAAAAIVGDALSHKHHHHHYKGRHSYRATPNRQSRVTVIHAPATPPVYVPVQPRVIVRHRPHFARHKAVIVAPAPNIIQHSQPRYRTRHHRQPRYVAPRSGSCRVRY